MKRILILILFSCLTNLASGQNRDSTMLDSVRIYPNPYYDVSSSLDSIYKGKMSIFNLPPSSLNITIYSLNGTLIREFKKTDQTSTMDWDLKNNKGYTISSGLYLVHILTEGAAEKILKIYVMMNPTMSTF